MTKTYIGTRIVSAWISEKDGRDGYAVLYDDGYVSWRPKDVFERCYRPLVDSEAEVVKTYGTK